MVGWYSIGADGGRTAAGGTEAVGRRGDMIQVASAEKALACIHSRMHQHWSYIIVAGTHYPHFQRSRGTSAVSAGGGGGAAAAAVVVE